MCMRNGDMLDVAVSAVEDADAVTQSSDDDADGTVDLASLPYGMRLPWGNP